MEDTKVGGADRLEGPVADTQTQALSDLLNRLEGSAEGDSITVRQIVQHLGGSSMAALMLAFSLISTSPASAIPGLTAFVAVVVLVLVVQMILGRDCVWLPGFVLRRQLSTDKLCKGIGWLRTPVRGLERLLRPRMTFLLDRPWSFLPLGLVLVLALFMPFMEFVPASGSIASGVIALMAAGFLTRDGGLVIVAMGLLVVIPVVAWTSGILG